MLYFFSLRNIEVGKQQISKRIKKKYDIPILGLLLLLVVNGARKKVIFKFRSKLNFI